MHLHCSGSGSPTVIIEAGASSFAIDFSLVQPKVAKTTRVCSYDRAGSGWSDARPDVETPIRVIRDLRTVLDTAGEKGPFVMVGASRGGVFVRLFQAEYPADVAGLVLIDPAAEDCVFIMFQGKGAAISSLTPEQRGTQSVNTCPYCRADSRASGAGYPRAVTLPLEHTLVRRRDGHEANRCAYCHTDQSAVPQRVPSPS